MNRDDHLQYIKEQQAEKAAKSAMAWERARHIARTFGDYLDDLDTIKGVVYLRDELYPTANYRLRSAKNVADVLRQDWPNKPHRWDDPHTWENYYSTRRQVLDQNATRIHLILMTGAEVL